MSDRSALAGPALLVAPRLLGARLTTVLDDGTVTVRITEVEAYGGADDPGSHAFRGRSARNATMFGGPGLLYAYRHLGLHTCLNVVTGPVGEPSAVLLRAGEVIAGVELAAARRAAAGVVRSARDLARGPARLAVALGLDHTWDGRDLFADVAVHLTLGTPSVEVHSGPRVGVAGPGGDASRHPWRLWLPDEPTVSDFRAATSRRPRARRSPSGTAD